ncbi:N-acetylneuraminate lyase-like [Halichondria panicea]|uniref:N-acetylneuraminate lyase-like n=1 Tax=Halichondria panicea TaxID=6063 RepID=UPI00312B326D
MPPRKRTRQETRKGSGANPPEKKLEEDLSQISIDELRKQLVDIGENPGPIDGSNKGIYVRLLTRKKLKLDTETSNDSSSFLDATSPSTSLTRSPMQITSVGYMQGGGGGRSPVQYRVAQSKTPTAKRTPITKSRASVPAKDFSSFEIRGLVAATFTPLTNSGDLNLSVIPGYAEHLLKSGVNNIFVNGSTGQSLCLTVGERKQLAEEWLRVSKGRITVIVHVGTESVKDTCELASHAQAIGAAAIGVQPTAYFKPSSIEQLVCYLEKVAEVASSLPMFYYHIPVMTAVNLDMEEFLDAASSRLPTLRGLKYTDFDLSTYSRCLTTHGGKYQIMYGRDEQVLGALCMGGIAAVGSTYNYAGRLNNRLFSAFKTNNMDGARLEMRRSQASIKLLSKYGGGVSVGREFMRLQGVNCGPPRLPLLPMTPEAIKNLESDLKDMGFFEWA